MRNSSNISHLHVHRSGMRKHQRHQKPSKPPSSEYQWAPSMCPLLSCSSPAWSSTRWVIGSGLCILLVMAMAPGMACQ